MSCLNFLKNGFIGVIVNRDSFLIETQVIFEIFRDYCENFSFVVRNDFIDRGNSFRELNLLLKFDIFIDFVENLKTEIVRDANPGLELVGEDALNKIKNGCGLFFYRFFYFFDRFVDKGV